MSIARIKSWVANEILTHTDLNTEVDNITTQVLPAASQNTVNTMTSTTEGLTPNHNLIVLATEKTTTSGTSQTFTSIPSGVRRISIGWVGVSTSGTSNLIIQLGDAGGIETTGYLGACTTIAGATPATANFTAGFGITNGHAAADLMHGTTVLTLENASTNTWTCSSNVSLSNATTINIGSGSKPLSQELNQVSVTTAGGADTFDAGVLNISYER